ncbi:secreted protein [Candidatus Magnetobacterium bavaricum]|uniref:Secreted protein n=1 Tax=Candidatus Magnetobacterium bavaricum TaxID=29290 RepID=A0A0F3H053_9BACT|nr:secreted protein [Candidatus Magnetobacterium bavaricum]
MWLSLMMFSATLAAISTYGMLLPLGVSENEVVSSTVEPIITSLSLNTPSASLLLSRSLKSW